jgi:hypothetical protein
VARHGAPRSEFAPGGRSGPEIDESCLVGEVPAWPAKTERPVPFQRSPAEFLRTSAGLSAVSHRSKPKRPGPAADRLGPTPAGNTVEIENRLAAHWRAPKIPQLQM